MRLIKPWLAVLVAVVLLSSQALVFAQTASPKPTIIFKAFNGQYHLSRDAQNHSLLTSEEVILADFPDSGTFTGIIRDVPTKYLGHSVSVKVLSVEDASGAPVPFKTSTDSAGNLKIVTGDPAIYIYGTQTFRIKYQTKDVVDLSSAKSDRLLLDINGRGWDQSFLAVSASLFIPKDVGTDLVSKPSCYIGYLNTVSYDCSINTNTNAQQTEIGSKSTAILAPHHTLVIDVNFKPATFAKPANSSYTGWVILVFGIAAGALVSVRWMTKGMKS